MSSGWRPVVGYKGLYEVHSSGKVRSVPRRYVNKNGVVRYLKSTTLKPSPDGGGYLKVNLYRNRKPKNIAIHRLVAKAFIPRIKGKNIVNHKNGIKSDNRKVNLEWVTDSENKIHAENLGLRKTRGSNNHFSVLNEGQVVEICKLLDTTVLTQSEIAAKFGVNSYVVSFINLGITWNHLTNRNGKVKPNNLKGGNHPSSVRVINCRGEKFDSMVEAGRAYGVTKHAINHNVKGRCKTAGKYPDGTRIIWKKL